MNKNIEELKKIRKEDFTDTDTFKIYGTRLDVSNILAYLIPILEGFEKRIIKLEKREGLFGPRIRLIKEKPIKIGGTDPD